MSAPAEMPEARQAGRRTPEQIGRLCEAIVDGRRARVEQRRQMLADLLAERFDAGRNEMAFDVLHFALATARARHLDAADTVDGVVAIAVAPLEVRLPQAEWFEPRSTAP